MSHRPIATPLTLAAALAVVAPGFAEDCEREPFPCSPKARAMADKVPRDRPCEDRHERSGYGLCVASWAKWTYCHNYDSYYVGGSQAPFHFTPRVCQHGRCPKDGTWGTDYAPWWSKVRLNWTHGQLHQDGGGQYQPDHKNFPFFLRFGRPKDRHHGERESHAHHEVHSEHGEHGGHESHEGHAAGHAGLPGPPIGVLR